MSDPSNNREAISLLKCPLYRLNHLYWIQDFNGNRVRFKMNAMQRRLFDQMHTFNVVLKARQMGFSTLICLMLLDACIFKSNTSAGIIAQTREDAEDIFQRKVVFAWNNFPEQIQKRLNVVVQNARQLAFRNGSSIRVGTSMRGSTFTDLHITEHGKICAKFPDRAREIRTGTLNTVHAGQRIIIESTAEGDEGDYYEICQTARDMANAGTPLSLLDFKFHFYAWWENPEYALQEETIVAQEQAAYFQRLKQQNIQLTPQQQAWYVKKLELMGEDMRREFPSTPEEAFATSGEGRYFIKEIAQLRRTGQICAVPFDRTKSVITGWDLGLRDSNCIWFAQTHGPYIKLIDFHSATENSLTATVSMLDEKARTLGYRYEMHFLPHDGRRRIQAHDQLWSPAQILERQHGLQVRVTDAVRDQRDGIRLISGQLPNMWFDAAQCAHGIKSIANYRKQWSTKKGGYIDVPQHNWASHGTKAMETLLLGIQLGINKAPILTTDDIERMNSELITF